MLRAVTGSFALPLKPRHGKNWSKDSMMQVARVHSFQFVWADSWILFKCWQHQFESALADL